MVFVVGSQRSGTRLPLHVMDCSPEIATFTEGSAPFFRGVLLQPLDRVEQLVKRSPSPVVALKPICETHRIHELLDRFPGSKAIWIFRHYAGAVRSASAKWKSGRDSLGRLAAGQLEGDWRAGGLSDERLQLVRRLYRKEMSLNDANAVMWYLRNALFFDLHTDTRAEVLLVRYEDLLSDPDRGFARMFDFIGVPIPASAAGVIRRSGGGSRPLPAMSEEIRSMCEELHNRLVTHYTADLALVGSIATAAGSNSQ